MSGFPSPTLDYWTFQQLTSGESTVPRLITTGTRSLSTGNLFLVYFTALKTELISQIRMSCIVAAGATPTLIRFGVWTASAAGALLAQVAATANDLTLLAAVTDYTKAFAAPFTKQAGVRYAVGGLVVTAASAPSISSISSVGAGGEQGQAPKLSGFVSGQADLPAAVAAGSVAGNANASYYALVP